MERISMQELILKMEKISKCFFATQALDSVSFGVKEGEVHILLGENGAGKSTLMKILSGSYQPDGGRIYWEGKDVVIPNPGTSLRLGIGMVYQELAVEKELSIYENIYIGRLPKKNMNLIDWKLAKENSKAILSKLGLDININKKIKDYDLGIQQLVEIARAISRDVKLIILDEPTSALTEKEVGMLFKAINLLKKQGVSFIYITHKLDEVFQIGDRVSVLRDGRHVGTIDHIEDQTEADFVKMMVGRTIDEQYPKEYNGKKEEAFRIENLSDNKHFYNVSFSLKKGEVLGIAGLVGAGNSELFQAIFGLHKIVKGSVYLKNKKTILKNPKKSIKMDIGLMNKDRKNSLLLHMPIFTNITAATFKKFSPWGFRKRKEELKASEKLIQDLRILAPNAKVKVQNLSGGNQQKVVLAKWLCSGAKIFLMDDPTRGIDVGAKVEVYKQINTITREGNSILLISSEMPELLGMSDRILIMKKGRIVGEYSHQEATQEKIMQKAAGGNV